MSNREPLLPIAWQRSEGIRASLALWIAAVVSGATCGVAAYYLISSDSSWLVAFVGVVIGFFAPYALAIAWNLTPHGAGRAVDEEWAKVAPIVRRTTR